MEKWTGINVYCIDRRLDLSKAQAF